MQDAYLNSPCAATFTKPIITSAIDIRQMNSLLDIEEQYLNLDSKKKYENKARIKN